MIDGLKHLKKNNLLHLKDKILITGDIKPLAPQEPEINPFDIKEDLSDDFILEVNSIDDVADFMRSSNKIQWLIDKGFKDVAIQLSNKPS